MVKKIDEADLVRYEQDPGLKQLKAYLESFLLSNIDNTDVRNGFNWLGDKATLIVNVASECGLTDQSYRELVDVHNKYKDQGL